MPTDPIVTTSVSFTVDDALRIANSLGVLATLISPASAGAVAAVTGAAALLRNTIMPAIEAMKSNALSIAEQATLQAESAAERARVNAPPATIN